MKNLILIAMTAVALTIFNGCQKVELESDLTTKNVEIQQTSQNSILEGLNTILMSVENNCMVFENENEFQKCLNLLFNLKEKDLSDFEQEIGFTSLRSNAISKGINCQIEDEIFATLLNPEMQIIIEHYLFTLNNEKRKVAAQFIGENYDLKSIKSQEFDKQEFSYDDNVFALIKNEKTLKSALSDYCGGEDAEHQLPDGIITKVAYNKYGIYNTLTAKIHTVFQGLPLYLKMETINSPLGTVPSGITSRCFYKRDGKQNNIGYSEGFVWDDTLKKTLWQNTRRLIGFRVDMKFTWSFYYPYQPLYDTAIIECHRY
ncbi:MAG: hypothetical protein ACQERU_09065 [Bacteroidota bacterium]